MADDIMDNDGSRARMRSSEQGAEHAADEGHTRHSSDASPGYSSSLAGDSRLRGRGNGSVQRSVLQRLQQTHGNRAVQRILQRSASGPATAEEDISEQIRSKSGGGSALDHGTRGQLEGGLGADMSGVRVHTDSEADQMARSVNSIAFTTGNDIFFSSGAYNPGSQDGMKLLAHEATHTVQQAAGPVAGTPSAGGVSISDPSDSFEQAADHAAESVVSGGPPPAHVQTMAATIGRTPLQRESEGPEEEEEQVQAKIQRKIAGSAVAVQRESEGPEEEEEQVQAKRAGTAIQRMAVQRESEGPEEEEEQVQAKRANTSVQRHAGEEVPV